MDVVSYVIRGSVQSRGRGRGRSRMDEIESEDESESNSGERTSTSHMPALNVMMGVIDMVAAGA